MTRLIGLTLLGLAVAAGTTVRAAELPTTDPRVDQLIENHIGAIGGYQKLKSIRTLVYSQGLYEESDYTGSGTAFMAFMHPYFRVVGNPLAYLGSRLAEIMFSRQSGHLVYGVREIRKAQVRIHLPHPIGANFRETLKPFLTFP